MRLLLSLIGVARPAQLLGFRRAAGRGSIWGGISAAARDRQVGVGGVSADAKLAEATDSRTKCEPPEAIATAVFVEADTVSCLLSVRHRHRCGGASLSALSGNHLGGTWQIPVNGAALGGEQAGGLVDVVDAVDQLAHRSPVTEPLQQWPSRRGIGPVLTAHQDQRSDKAGIGGVEVLRCEAGRSPARCLPAPEDRRRLAGDSAGVLPQRVGEVLGDLGSEDVGRLVAVEPGRDTGGCGLRRRWATGPYPERAVCPSIDAESIRRARLHDRQCLVQ